MSASSVRVGFGFYCVNVDVFSLGAWVCFLFWVLLVLILILLCANSCGQSL